MSEATWCAELRRWLDEEARDAGFDRVGVAAVHDPAHPAAAEHADRFVTWVEQGRAGEMEYLKRRDEQGTLLRSALQVALPWARSVVVCALNYNANAPRSIDPTPRSDNQPPRLIEQPPHSSGWIARYAWSGRPGEDGVTMPTDYHHELLSRLRRIEAGLLEQTGCSTRSYVDTGPMVERALAGEAGVGWIGKNTCVIGQGLGSWLLLGVIVTSLRVEDSTPSFPAADRCGSCTRCIDACPTDALLGGKDATAPRTMDASRCIAYLTIEKKGAIDQSLRAAMGRQVFGCDICQDVCPWNRRAPIGSNPGMQARPELVNPALDWLAGLTPRDFKQQFKGSPLERTGRKRLLRNVAIAMGNSLDRQHLPQLELWRAGEDKVLAEAAEWARRQILVDSSADDSSAMDSSLD